MITWFAGIQRQITDFVVGGKVRTKFEAIAVEMEAQDFQIYKAIKKAIPTSIYQAFSFNILPAVRAAGLVTFTASPAPSTDIIIPAGVQVATIASTTSAEKIYETTVAVTLPAGQSTVAAAISCTKSGSIGNTGVGTITALKSTVSGITEVSNATALTNGVDKETEDARRTRFQSFISTLTRGTDSALIYGAKSANLTDANGAITERVTAAVVVGPPASGSAGTATVYIYNGSTGASSNLIAAVQKIIDGSTDATGNMTPGYKAAGVVVTVAAATTVSQSVTATITILPGYSASAIQGASVSTISTYIQSLTMGQTLIYNELIERVMGISGVLNVSITAPNADVTATKSQVIIPGTITVTVP